MLPLAVCGRQASGARRYHAEVAVVRLFAAAREAAGVGRDEVPGDTVDAVLSAARRRYGERFEAVLGSCRVWKNGDEVAGDTEVSDADEIAVLPPVSGGR